MAVTDEQWAAVADEFGLTVDELHAKIAEVNKAAPRQEHTFYLDHDLEPLSLAEWAFLFESRSYRLLRETTLPDGTWIATIWRGLSTQDPPTVMETSVFPHKRDPLPPSSFTAEHLTLADALAGHEQVVVTQKAKKSGGEG